MHFTADNVRNWTEGQWKALQGQNVTVNTRYGQQCRNARVESVKVQYDHGDYDGPWITLVTTQGEANLQVGDDREDLTVQVHD